MAFTFRSSTQAQSATCAKPAGAVSGDFLTAFVLTAEDDDITPPTGFEPDAFFDDTLYGDVLRLRIYSKIAGGSEPDNYVWTDYAGSFIYTAISCWNQPTNPEYAGVAGMAESEAAPTTLAAAQVTTPVDGCLIVYGLAADGTNTWSGPGAPVTVRASDNGQGFADEVQASAGLSASRTFTCADAGGVLKISLTAAYRETAGEAGISIPRPLSRPFGGPLGGL